MIKRIVSVLALVLVLGAFLVVPCLAYTGTYGSLSSNMLNTDYLQSVQFQLTDFTYKGIESDEKYRLNFRTDISNGQWELYPYYTTATWYAKSTSLVPFRTLFPYVKAGDTLNLAYASNAGGIFITLLTYANSDGFPVDEDLRIGSPVLVTEDILNANVTIKLYKNASNNVYLRALGAYTGSLVIPESAGIWTYAPAIYTSWTDTKNAYEKAQTEFIQSSLDSAYGNGYRVGKAEGYDEGFRAGREEATTSDLTFNNLVGSVISAPLHFLQGMFGWELLGVNLWAFFRALLTVVLMFGITTLIVKAVF